MNSFKNNLEKLQKENRELIQQKNNKDQEINNIKNQTFYLEMLII